MGRFSQIAEKKMDEIEKPPLAPVGLYTVEVINDAEPVERPSASGNFEIVDFMLRGVEAVDVDPEELEAFGPVKNMVASKSFIFNEDDETANARTEYNMKLFLTQHLGLSEDLSIAEAISEAKGAQCVAQISHRPDKNSDDIYLNVKKTMAMD